MSRATRPCLSLIFALTATLCAPAQITPAGKFMQSHSDSGDAFGASIAVAGDLAVIGAPLDDTYVMQDGGTAWIFRNVAGAWTEEAMLLAYDFNEDAYFGNSVALSGGVVVVGAFGARPWPPHGLGEAYVFELVDGAWQGTDVLLPAQDGQQFGRSVAIDGDLIAVSETGAVYLFRKLAGDWTQVAKLPVGGGLGQPVAVSSGTVFVGTPFTGAAGSGSGSVLVYREVAGTWSQVAELVAPDAAAGDAFGSAIAACGELLVAGAPGDDDHGASSGSAWLLRDVAGAWTPVAKLLDEDGQALDRLGASVGVSAGASGPGVSLGAHRDSTLIDEEGSASVFRELAGVWYQVGKVFDPAGVTFDEFGAAVALDGDGLLVGAPRSEFFVLGIGAVSAYTLDPLGVFTDVGRSLAGTAGAPLLTGCGTLLPDSDVSFLLGNALPSAPSAFVVGAGLLGAPFKGGTLVPTLDLVLALPTDALGGVQLGGRWPSGIPAGAHVLFQWWIVDGGGPVGFAASNALVGTTP